MKREVWYVAHPVAGDAEGNARRARRWLAWLMESEPSISFVVPWLACLAAGADDSDPMQRERGIADCVAAAERCDGVVLVGGRVSSGMDRERDAVLAAGGDVADLTHLGIEAPDSPMPGVIAKHRNRPVSERATEQLRARGRSVEMHFERALGAAVERLDAGVLPTDDELDAIARLEARAGAVETLLYSIGGRR